MGDYQYQCILSLCLILLWHCVGSLCARILIFFLYSLVNFVLADQCRLLSSFVVPCCSCLQFSYWLWNNDRFGNLTEVTKPLPNTCSSNRCHKGHNLFPRSSWCLFAHWHSLSMIRACLQQDVRLKASWYSPGTFFVHIQPCSGKAEK